MMLAIAPDHPVCVARELTKKFETWYRGNVDEVISQLGEGKVKGEITLIIAGKQKARKIIKEQKSEQI